MYPRSIMSRVLPFPSWITCAVLLLGTLAVSAQEQQTTGTLRESPIHWQHTAPIEIPAENAAAWIDMILTPEIFDGARYDLHDLRVYTSSGAEVPYALLRNPRS